MYFFPLLYLSQQVLHLLLELKKSHQANVELQMNSYQHVHLFVRPFPSPSLSYLAQENMCVVNIGFKCSVPPSLEYEFDLAKPHGCCYQFILVLVL
jgi:hypothetical protein